MGLKENATATHTFNTKEGENVEARSLCLHAFCDMSHVSPVVFLYLLKECYIYGTCKASAKFRALQHQVYLVLHNGPRPGPATYVLQCLCVLPIFELFCDGFSHLIMSCLSRIMKRTGTPLDILEAKDQAAQLFTRIVRGLLYFDEKIVVKIVQVFDIEFTDVQKVMCRTKGNTASDIETAKQFVEKYILELAESQSYATAVDLLEHFSIRLSDQSFLHHMLHKKEFKAAEKWATFMGKPMLSLLVKEYANMDMLKSAYEIIKKNNLREDFPEVYHQCKESSLKKLVGKGCWDVAEARTNNDRQLIEYLVHLAMEAGYLEKADELCDRYSLKYFPDVKDNLTLAAALLLLCCYEVPYTSAPTDRFLELGDLHIEDIIWVDEVDGLCDATRYIEECKVIGIDCEWKPNSVKGSKQTKVSIIQIASDKMVFILDLIKLAADVPDILSTCLARILQSTRILKLGYSFHCDIQQLAKAYGELNCFKQYGMLLDIQKVYKEHRGGLSGLAKKILGAGLNKTRRNSDWEQRPLTQKQLEYAALDAAVLIHIFRHLPSGLTNGYVKFKDESDSVSVRDNTNKSKNVGESTESSAEPTSTADQI